MLRYLTSYFKTIKDKDASFDCTVILRSGQRIARLNMVDVRTDVCHFEERLLGDDRVNTVMIDTTEIAGFSHP